jgi:hypothetical protein
MQTCPICGKKAKIWHPGDYKICSCTGDCGDFEISGAAESAMGLGKYDGDKIGTALRRRRDAGRVTPRIMEHDLAVLHAEGSG